MLNVNCGATKNRINKDVNATSKALKVISHGSRVDEGFLEKKYVNVRNANANGLARSWNQVKPLTGKIGNECAKAASA